MAIQNRRGAYTDFDATKMVAGEWAVVQSGDPNSTRGRAVYMAFQNGEVERMATYEDMEENIDSATADIRDSFTGDLQTAISNAQSATSAANTAASSASSAASSASSAATSATTAATNANNAADAATQAAANIPNFIVEDIWVTFSNGTYSLAPKTGYTLVNVYTTYRYDGDTYGIASFTEQEDTKYYTITNKVSNLSATIRIRTIWIQQEPTGN